MLRQKKWRTQDGRALELAEMTTLHVFNTRAYLRKKVVGAMAQGLLRVWIDRFTAELDRRAALQLEASDDRQEIRRATNQDRQEAEPGPNLL